MTNTKLERRVIQLNNRLYEIRMKPDTFKGKSVIAIQVLRDLGATEHPTTDLTNAVARKVFASPNNSAHVIQSVLDSITRSVEACFKCGWLSTTGPHLTCSRQPVRLYSVE